MKKQSALEVSKVYVVFKTHLDIGFTDYAAVVKQQYIDAYIPAAMKVARQLRERGGLERFVWTTGSWLIYEYLETGSARQRKDMEAAIAAGDIAWHGLPFTTQSELMDASLFQFGLSLGRKLDERFGKVTMAAKMTDVPGHTRAIVPWLAQAGIRFLHIGVNSAVTPPDVPDVFTWRHSDGSSVIVMYDKTGYGTTAHIPGMASALAIAHTNDNMGPSNPDEILQTYAILQRQFPNAQLVAARLDDFAADVLAIKDTLPVVTQEIGDTWIHGAGTDPLKVSQYRELCRLRTQWLAGGAISPNDRRLERFSRFLMVIPEHTWGMDEKTHLDDYQHYDAAGLRRLRRTAKCKRFELSWAEQRAYITQAVAALKKGSVQHEATRALQALIPARPALKSMTRLPDPTASINTPTFEIGFNQAGAISRLVDQKTGTAWATARNTLGTLRYQTFSAADYERFGKQYVRNWPNAVDWAIKDLTKPGMESTGVQHMDYGPTLDALYQRSLPGEERLLLEMHMPAEPVAKYGCPARLVVEFTLPHDRQTVEISLQWFDKKPCRLPEALWYAFQPRTARPSAWMLDKMGSAISALDVARNGNRHLHAVGKGVSYDDGRHKLSIESLDAALVAPGEPMLLDFNNHQPQMKNGMHFNLYNNIWGTNFPMWYEENARFRFSLHFDETRAGE